MTRKSLDAAIDRAARSLAEYFETGEVDTNLLRSAAEDVVAIRSEFHRADGGTDWGGRTPGYREAIREVYTRAHLTPEQTQPTSFTSKLSYHVRSLISKQVPADELAAEGLNAEAPKERQNAKREANAAVAATLSPEIGPVEMIVYADRLLKRAASEGLEGKSARELKASAIALDAIETHTKTLRAAVAGKKTRRGSR